MRSRTGRARPVLAGAAVLAAALAVELVDELVDGAKSAALPRPVRSLLCWSPSCCSSRPRVRSSA